MRLAPTIELGFMASEAVTEYLRRAPAPVSLKKLKSDLHLSDVDTSAAFVWPNYRGAARFWHRDPAEVIREKMLHVLADAALTRKDVIAQVTRNCYNCGRKPAEQALAGLTKEGVIKTARIFGQTALHYRADRPQTLAATSMRMLMERLKKFDAGQQSDLPERILDAVRRLQPGPGVPVTVQSLRAAIPGAAKPEFDEAVLSLADRQKLFLTTHDHGWALPESEREQLVFDGGQKLYVAVTLRD